MNTVMIRGLEVGKGAPKVFVPIVAKTKAGILDKARELKNYTMDLVEWRVDFYDDIMNIETTIQTAKELKEILGDTPILFTFRTSNEGGNKAISQADYTALNKALAESGYIDAVDVEIFVDPLSAKQNIENVHAAGLPVIGSNHDFAGTPDKADLLYRLRTMQAMGADIPKIAVMPQNRADVITLIDATQEMYTKYATRPILTMSMSPLGVITRISGEAFGSCATFGAVGQVSAPGQIPVEKLQAAMAILHDAL